GFESDALIAEVENDGLALAHSGGDRTAVHCRERRPDGRQLPPEPLPEPRQVRLDQVVDELILDVEEAHVLDVELLEQLVAQRLDTREFVSTPDPDQDL